LRIFLSVRVLVRVVLSAPPSVTVLVAVSFVVGRGVGVLDPTIIATAADTAALAATTATTTTSIVLLRFPL
jgi:hypothetical protein